MFRVGALAAKLGIDPAIQCLDSTNHAYPTPKQSRAPQSL